MRERERAHDMSDKHNMARMYRRMRHESVLANAMAANVLANVLENVLANVLASVVCKKNKCVRDLHV